MGIGFLSISCRHYVVQSCVGTIRWRCSTHVDFKVALSLVATKHMTCVDTPTGPFFKIFLFNFSRPYSVCLLQATSSSVLCYRHGT